jgi:membrane associated rhomboid family serine protease
MRLIWHRFLQSLTPGVRTVLGVLAVAYLAEVMGRWSSAFDLSAWLALSGPAFWKGRVWSVITFVLLPAGILDFLFNGMMITCLGPLIERAWSRGQLWSFCLITAAGAGLVKVVFQPSNSALLTGTGPVVFGLLAAWARLYGGEEIRLGFIWQTTARRAALALAAITFLMMAARAGLVEAVVTLSGGLVGWLYLSLRWKVNLARRSRPVTSERMSRLEL